MPEKSRLTTSFLPNRRRFLRSIVVRVSGYGMNCLLGAVPPGMNDECYIAAINLPVNCKDGSFRDAAQVGNPDFRILPQVGSLPFEDDLSCLEHVGTVRDGERHGGVLLDEE